MYVHSITILGNNGVIEPNGSSRILQRSISLQPSTAAASSAASNQSQYHQLHQQKFFLNNYTNNQNTSYKPNSPPAKMARLNSSPASATITSQEHHELQQKQLPAPLTFPIHFSYTGGPSGASSAMESPAAPLKIDYNKFELPATSPSIKIDLSNFNQQVTKPTASSNLDEDYDI